MNVRRRLLVPEVVQTSAMDCGPACLKALLEGYGIRASYEALRQSCQTDVDGSSIDTMELLASELGLEAEQIMVPVDHLFLRSARALPAIVVVRLPNGMSHFVVLWGRCGNWVQVMDPANGRQWLPAKRFLEHVHVHSQAVSANGWREWASSDEFLNTLRRRMRGIGVSKACIATLLRKALSSSNWRPVAVLDAAVRMITPMVKSGGLRRARDIDRLLGKFFEHAISRPEEAFQTIPPTYWSVLPARDASDEEEQVVFRGAVLVRALRRQKTVQAASEPNGPSAKTLPATSTMRQVFRMLRADGLLTPAVVAGTTVVAAAGVVAEALLYRTFMDLTRMLGLSQQRIGAFAIVIGFLLALAMLDLSLISRLLAMGRRLETRVRMHLFYTLPRLSDRYFGARLVSDMAERSHAIHDIRVLPVLGQQLLHGTFQLALTTLGIVWLDPQSAPLAVALAGFSIVLPLLAQPLVAERDLRFRTHTGGLCRFYFDALRGLIPMRTHGAAEAIRTEHESLLVNWVASGVRLQRASVAIGAAMLAVDFALVAALLLSYFARMQESAVPLLLVYWALNVPVLGSQVADLALQYPRQRNLASRLLEPLDEPREAQNETEVPREKTSGAAAIAFESVSVRALGQTILEDINLNVEPGSHICIVGASGAGKSSLVSLLLGFHAPSSGQILVDGKPLDAAQLDALRRDTAWLDPNVQLWNRSLLENLRYGASDSVAMSSVLEESKLMPLIEKLPDGLATKLGESGALVSGGEGQRVRLGRALLRPSARLVILDEPFSSLDRQQRQRFLESCRKLWKGSTLLCITHDLQEAASFDRIVVVEQGRIVEDGSPAALLKSAESIYRRMLESEKAILKQVWSDGGWRRIQVASGHASDGTRGSKNEQRPSEQLLANTADR
jgi:ABC-type bacteriocin/lantibiotic exporter with double-glycine peptidase domain